MKKYIFVSVFILLVIGILGIYHYHFQKNTIITQKPSSLKNASYLIDGEKITLVNGSAEEASAPDSASKNTFTYLGNEAIGDINGNGKDDTAFILTEQTGGTGIFYYVAVFLDGATSTNAVFIGDRIIPQTTEIKNGIIIVTYLDRAPGDPMAAEPSVGTSKYFTVVGNELKEISNLNTAQ
jgi:hypothetical protein